jgi:hypothetical protein
MNPALLHNYVKKLHNLYVGYKNAKIVHEI